MSNNTSEEIKEKGNSNRDITKEIKMNSFIDYNNDSVSDLLKIKIPNDYIPK